MAPKAVAQIFDRDNQMILERAGFPSFDEFAKNPDKYRKRSDELFVAMDNGSQTELRKEIRGEKYIFDGYKVDTIEQLERILFEEDLKEADVVWRPVLYADHTGRKEVVHYIERKNKIILAGA